MKKMIDTNLERYNTAYTIRLPEVREKSNATMIEQYGSLNYNNITQIQQTKFEKYGDKNYTNRPQAIKTHIEKYGKYNTNPAAGIKTKLERYGTLDFTYKSIPTKIARYGSLSGLMLFHTYTKLKQKYAHVADFEFSEHEYAGSGAYIMYPFKCKICDTKFMDNITNGIAPKCPTCYPIIYTKISKFQRRVYDHILKTYPDALLEVHLPAINKYADILIPSINKIVECHGDYWHCNPEMYKSDYYHKRIHLTAQEIWNNDSLRIKILESAGYVVEVVWEDKVDNYINNTQF
jgi:hypothetical protein